MYTTYFGLKEKPFSIAPNPEYLYMSRQHQEALAHLTYGIQEDGCLALLTGDVGTGKTTICRYLLERIPERTDVAVILNPKISSLDLLRTICEELQIDCPLYAEATKIYIDALNEQLLRSHAAGRSTILIIDEAQGLTPQVLEQLRLLTNLETNTHKLLKILLLGQPELETTLASPELAQVNQRITSRYHLSPLQYDECVAYVIHRMHIGGGGQSQFFSDRALRILFTESKGVPRLINLVCDRALLGAYAESLSTVDKGIMIRAAHEILHRQNSKRTSTSRVIITLLLFIAIITIPAFFFMSQNMNSNDKTNTPPPSGREETLPVSDAPAPTAESQENISTLTTVEQ